MPLKEPGIALTLDHLCSMPGLAHAMLTSRQVRQLLAMTSGEVMANGRLYDIQTESRGAGMYTVRLKRRKYA